MNKGLTVKKICLVALAVCINVVGGQIALLLRLPVYLDSIGTLLTGVLLGPAYGMIPNLLSGVAMGMAGDIYSLYFAPVGMITGLMAGLAAKAFTDKLFAKKGMLFLAAVIVTVPGTILSALICAGLFGGITSSGSAILVQLLSHTPLGTVGSVFVVQIVTDYLDRLISLFTVGALLRMTPADFKMLRSKKRKEV